MWPCQQLDQRSIQLHTVSCIKNLVDLHGVVQEVQEVPDLLLPAWHPAGDCYWVPEIHNASTFRQHLTHFLIINAGYPTTYKDDTAIHKTPMGGRNATNSSSCFQRKEIVGSGQSFRFLSDPNSIIASLCQSLSKGCPNCPFEHLVDLFVGLGGTLHWSKFGQNKA